MRSPVLESYRGSHISLSQWSSHSPTVHLSEEGRTPACRRRSHSLRLAMTLFWSLEVKRCSLPLNTTVATQSPSEASWKIEPSPCLRTLVRRGRGVSDNAIAGQCLCYGWLAQPRPL